MEFPTTPQHCTMLAQPSNNTMPMPGTVMRRYGTRLQCEHVLRPDWQSATIRTPRQQEKGG
eukprot:2540172-Pyramimonas_sp.AAC.1